MATQLGKLAKKEGDDALLTSSVEVAKALESAVVVNHAHDYEREEVLARGLSADGKERTRTIVQYEGHYDAHGLSLFTPLDQMNRGEQKFKDFLDAQYQYMSFPQETGWGDWLLDFNKQLVDAKNKAATGKTDAPDYQPEVPAGMTRTKPVRIAVGNQG
jgi:hypothetical protein